MISDLITCELKWRRAAMMSSVLIRFGSAQRFERTKPAVTRLMMAIDIS